MPRKAKATPATTETATNKVETPVVETVAKKKEYGNYDLIPCQSLVNGTLYYLSPKSNTMYTWEDNGAIVDVTYEDLLVMKQTHSGILYKPCVVITDKDLLAQARWADIRKVYDDYDVMSLSDAEKVIELDPLSLKKALEKLTPPMRGVICDTAVTMIGKGSLDSIAKIKAIDEVCGTELYTVAFR